MIVVIYMCARAMRCDPAELANRRVPVLQLRRHDNARQSALMAKLISRSIRQMARVTLVYRRGGIARNARVTRDYQF